MIRRWTEGEDFQVRRFYKTEPRENIMQRLPGRTWEAIQCRACTLKVKRIWKPRVVKTSIKPITQLQSDLIAGRLRKKLTQVALAKRIGIMKQSQISTMEGGGGVSLFMLTAWCDALGLELRAMPKQIVGKRTA